MRLALAGDTMLGRGVARELATVDPRTLVAPEVAELMQAADVTVLNLECCISDRGTPIALPDKPFFFRAPPQAVELLVHLGVDCVTLANNHALDYGAEALHDTFVHLAAAGIEWVGAGPDLDRARTPCRLASPKGRLVVLGFTDHPAEYAATPHGPGVAYAPLRDGIDDWLRQAIAAAGPEPVLVTAHWGPNMRAEPLPYIRAAAAGLVDAGATVVAGHSAHVFQGVQGNVLYDLGDFLDDYRVDPVLRNDLGVLFLVDIDDDRSMHVETVPLKLDFCRTRLADGDDAVWIRRRLSSACAALY